MQDLIHRIKQLHKECDQLPFSLYASVKEQHILNVPIHKPLLIMVLSGRKQIGKEFDIEAGNFVFLSNTPGINMRNIPDDTEYFAVLIEFEFDDFNCFPNKMIQSPKDDVIHGAIEPLLMQNLKQMIEWVAHAPSEIWGHRRQELIITLEIL